MARPTHPLVARWRRAARAAAASESAALPASWGAAKLLVVAALSPLLGAIVAVRALRATVRAGELLDAFPDVVARVARGVEVDHPDLPGRALQVARRPACGRYVITSDLHRSTAGALDVPRRQGTDHILDAAMARYAADGWTLVENGDIEDFWVTGGSAYGVVYDVARLVANALPARWRRRVLPEIYGDHLDRIVADNEEAYRRIAESFGPERYVRIVGNHDDPLLDPRVVARLRRHLPVTTVYDALVLDGPAGAVGVVLHGHQTDAWNLPGRDLLGKFATWLASAVVDAPFVRTTPGLPGPEAAAALVGGRQPDRLMPVGRHLGVNGALYSLDEVRLWDAWRRRFGFSGAAGERRGPALVLGHTHVPLADPVAPGADPADPSGAWWAYLNSGCGVLPEVVTAVEWDGTVDPERPELRLVVWRYGTDAHDAGGGGRPVVREELARPHGSTTLRRRGVEVSA